MPNTDATDATRPSIPLPIVEKREETIHEFAVRQMSEASPADPTIREHLERAGIVPLGQNKETGGPLHDWRRQALFGRFAAQHLVEETRMSSSAFSRLMNEVLNGRI